MSRIIILLICLIYPLPCYAMTVTGLMRETVGVGKDGFAILLIVGCAVAAFIGKQICKIIGENNFAILVGIVATFVATLIMVNKGFEIVNKLLAYF